MQDRQATIEVWNNPAVNVAQSASQIEAKEIIESYAMFVEGISVRLLPIAVLV